MAAKLKSAKNWLFRELTTCHFFGYFFNLSCFTNVFIETVLWPFLRFKTFYKVKASKKWLWTSNSVKNRLFLELFSCHFFCSFFSFFVETICREVFRLISFYYCGKIFALSSVAFDLWPKENRIKKAVLFFVHPTHFSCYFQFFFQIKSLCSSSMN